MKTAIYTVLFSLISIATSFSQTSLEGHVQDAVSGESIILATVALYKNDVLLAGVETDLDGNYFFKNIDPGTYEVEASYIGHTAQRHINVIVQEGKVNRLDFELAEGVLMDAVEIKEYKVPLVEMDRTTTGVIVTGESIRRLPTKKIRGMASSVSGVSSKDRRAVPISGAISMPMGYSMDGVHMEETNLDLPESGQMTAGEWNDLHNWKEWLELLEEENYGIMMERFDIRPTNRYSVMVVNQENAVLPNINVQLLDKNGEVIWETYTDNSGKAELWEGALGKTDHASRIIVGAQEKRDIVSIEEGSNTFVLKTDCVRPEKMDIVFTVDATSSMNDEITYLKSELLDVINKIKATNEEVDFNLGSVFYRDKGDTYLTRVSELSNEIEKTIMFVGQQNSSGGGDHPEAVESAIEETLKLNWREDALKVVFLILDAPPHEDNATMIKIRSQIKEAARRGIKLIPVTASGIGRETEFLMKFMAILTNGTYVFITDDSGIGNPHLDPVVDDYEVEKLNDCLVRLITQYSKSYSCNAPRVQESFEVDVFPNPATQYINVKTDQVPDYIKIYSANGMMVKSIKPEEKRTRIDMQEFVNGIYTIAIIVGDQIESKQIILLK